jgi:hypothetical protein
MKKNSAILSLALNAKRGNLPYLIAVLSGLSILIGMFLTDTSDEFTAYLLLTFACATPCIIWISAGGVGIPIMPAISILVFIYYAVPILRKNTVVFEFGPSEILLGAVTVTSFLLVATVIWALLIVGRADDSSNEKSEILSKSQSLGVMFFGLASGIFFYVAANSGWLNWVGPFFGLLRSALLMSTVVGCFMLGHLRGRGSLRGRNFAIAVTCLLIVVFLTWASLFLVGGMTFCLAGLFGYTATTKRVPWRMLVASVIILTVLHAGKDQMRTKYWGPSYTSGAQISVFQMPLILVEWFGEGLSKISSSEEYTSIVDRASLLNLLMRVQRMTPDYVPYLGGKSYAVLPEMLIPRFLAPDKIASQAAMDMLNVEYGFLTFEETKKVAIGWGLIAEAYANFSYLGVMAIGFLFGLLCGLLERWSVGAPLISLPSFVAIATAIVLTNLEADLAALVTNLSQSVAVVSLIYWSFGLLSKQKKRSASPQQIPETRG